ncbi:STAS domain-containing protein [Actinomadura parmotrematis]|uniref:Anti-sigma factor antagonist n=1 Tax=Actinomadura parmotrematis TaxID=2864039 RepID=A0ABS7FZQ2_9ACTN|nr:STAS domain-containing protein [Actinomadura parmotrematis]MBW8485927.1 STAS domain-containing protein [Actinomadura parmotrematis]
MRTPALQVHHRRLRHCHLVSVCGEIDISTARALRERLLAAVADASAPLVLDLHRVPFMDSSGLGVLASLAEGAARRGLPVRLTELRPQVATVLAVTGLDQLVPIVPTLDRALRFPLPDDDGADRSPAPRWRCAH